jgi:hypothetical protein
MIEQPVSAGDIIKVCTRLNGTPANIDSEMPSFCIFRNLEEGDWP